MNSTNLRSNPNPRDTATCISNLIWWWTKDIFEKGYRKILVFDDLYNPRTSDLSTSLGDKLEKQWNIQLNHSQKTKRKPSLIKALFYTFRRQWMALIFIHTFCEFGLTLPIPVLLGMLVKCFQPQSTSSYVIVYAGALIVANFLHAFFFSHFQFISNYLAGRMRIALTSLAYRKALRLSKTALGTTPPGKIINFMASDVERLTWAFYFINYIWIAPLLALIVGLILYMKIGNFAFVGITTILVVTLVQVAKGKFQVKYRTQTLMRRDERVRLMNEIISGVHIIKMYVWEKPFRALLEEARKLELRKNNKILLLRNFVSITTTFIPRMALYCTIIALMIFDQKLSYNDVVTFTLFYYILTEKLTFSLITGVNYGTDCYVSLQRIRYFLILDEFNPGNVTNEGLSITNLKSDSRLGDHSNSVISVYNESNSVNKVTSENNKETKYPVHKTYTVNFENFHAKWDLTSSNEILQNINLKLEKGKLYAVIGLVGSGKSSFLSAILGEMCVVCGHVETQGRLTYTDQESWIFGDTIRQNILFGESFDEDRYNRTIELCALPQDLKQLPCGDLFVIGERGISLSGGQKARISLARAIYRQADIYLLDDPLSAVDAYVGHYLFQNCIKEYLKNTTRILVTHQLQFVRDVDGIIFINEGKSSYYENYQKLIYQYPEYKYLFNIDKNDGAEKSSVTATHKLAIKNDSLLPTNVNESHIKENINDVRKLEDIIEKSSKRPRKSNLLLKYLCIGSNPLLVSMTIISFIAAQTVATLDDFFVPYLIKVDNSLWNIDIKVSSADLNKTNAVIIRDIHPAKIYIYIYSGIIVLVFFTTLWRLFAFLTVCFRSSKQLHNLALKALMRTSLRFFHDNPSGRIINRFSKETAIIDEDLPKTLLDGAQLSLMVFAALIIICILRPIFLIPALILIILCYFITKIYLKTSKCLRRLNATTRAPIFTYLNETLNGISTIRAYRAKDILKIQFEKFQDINTCAWYMNISCDSVYTFILKILVSTFITITVFIFVAFRNNFNELEVGLIISQLIMVSNVIEKSMLRSADAMNALVSVEQILQYVQLPPENNFCEENMAKKKKNNPSDHIIPSEYYQEKGCIKFKNVSLRYSAENEPVLKNLNFLIKSTEKIGIVGRTGAGKSSLISAIFRLSDVEGMIEIDGIDTKSIELETLRKHISIIPQDPVLFSGTLRRNLDPFNKFSDESLWDALNEVELKDAIVAFEKGLNCDVLHKGSNFSIGQRQLICLARAILKKNRILIMDEATANIDIQTDAVIQRTIRTKFSLCTVLTVAHRLSTIIDSDKVMVIDNGHLIEFDHPYILLSNESSMFSGLVKESGTSMYQILFKSAKQHYDENNTRL